MRFLVVLLALAPLAATGANPSCPWKEPASPPKLEVVDGTVRFTWPLNESWFGCARGHGGAMNVGFFLRNARGQVSRAKLFTRSHGPAVESVPVADLCDAAIASEAQVRVVGTGPMDRLLFQTPFVDLPCFSCPRPAVAELSAGMSDPDAPAGFVTVTGRYDLPFHGCAQKAANGTLALRVFVGQSQPEAAARRDHSFVLRGLEKEASFRKAFAPTNLCAEGRWIGLEYFGTGEFRQLNVAHRETLELKCPKAL